MSLVVLTGASRGIGRATALALSARKLRLVLLGRPSEPLTRTAEQTQATQIDCDLADPASIQAAAKQVLALGTPQAVIHNAGVIHRALVEELALDSYDEQLAVNLRGPFLLTQALLPAMRASRSGRHVFVGSIASTLGTPRSSAYNASKWGLVGFVKSLAEEIAGSGLSAVCVLPGSVDTRMLRGSGFEPRIAADEVAQTLVHYALDAPLAHNGGVVEMFGA